MARVNTLNFATALLKFSEKVKRQNKEIFDEAVDIILTSITVGSPITSAPGQPVDTGALLASWKRVDLSPSKAQVISEGLPYTIGIEDGVGPNGPINLRSAVGGWHSVKMTRAAWHPIVQHAVDRVVSKGGTS